MNIINEEKYLERKMDILNFMAMNRDKYEDKGIEYEIAILTDFILAVEPSLIPTGLRQILSKFDVFESGNDIYKEMLKLLEKYSFLKGNCCEIAAGTYPRLAELTAPKINMQKGTLTIYEPNILFTEVKNATIKKEEFTKETNIESIDTLYSLFPCEATIAMAEKAFEEDKNLMLAFCACDHSTKEYQKWIGDYWAEDFCMDFKEKYGKEAEIIKWPSSSGINLPILVRQSSKNKQKIMK